MYISKWYLEPHFIFSAIKWAGFGFEIYVLNVPMKF